MVKIHGNWCGPNWTGGQRVSARDYLLSGGNFRGPCIDQLDCACRAHDKGCSGVGGCTRKADTKLIAECDKILGNPLFFFTNPRMYAAARLVREGITVAAVIRGR